MLNYLYGIIVNIARRNCMVIFIFKQKTAYEMRISDWSSDVCSSDLLRDAHHHGAGYPPGQRARTACAVSGAARRHASARCAGSDGVSVLFTGQEIGRASCRERVYQYVLISVVAVSLKKQNLFDNYINKTQQKIINHHLYNSYH